MGEVKGIYILFSLERREGYAMAASRYIILILQPHQNQSLHRGKAFLIPLACLELFYQMVLDVPPRPARTNKPFF